MKRVFVGWILTAIAVAVTASLSIGAFQTRAVYAESETVVSQLAVAKSVDQEARAKYLTAQAEKKAAEAAEQARQAEQARIAATVTRTNAVRTVTTKKPVAKPVSCDRLIIPKIGLNTCLATVGLTSGGAVGVHASLPAWFNQSSRAGTSSGKYRATFIDGHRSGIFRNLSRLAVGDQITVTFINGESYTYTVRATETTPLAQVNMAKALAIYGGAGQGLNLMTCDGAYNSNIGTAERRLTVYAGR